MLRTRVSARDLMVEVLDRSLGDEEAASLMADEMRADLTAAGYAVVPIEPTDEMLKAALAACWPVQKAREDQFVDVVKVMERLRPMCRAMLTAAT